MFTVLVTPNCYQYCNTNFLICKGAFYMIWIIIGILVGITIAIIDIIKEGYEFTRPTQIITLCILISMLPLVTCSSICSLCCENDYVKVNEIEISALKDNNNMSGNFFIGIGYIDEEMNYYYVENTEKGKIVKKIDANNVYIVEDNEEQPRIEEYKAQFKNEKWLLIAANCNNSYKKIYIPENSITNEYNIDLE